MEEISRIANRIGGSGVDVELVWVSAIVKTKCHESTRVLVQAHSDSLILALHGLSFVCHSIQFELLIRAEVERRRKLGRGRADSGARAG